jgi:DNA-binding NarL/FixJ family response regulator
MTILPEKLIITDDHPLFRAALMEAVKRHAPSCEFLEASSFEQLQTLLEDHADADLLLMDLHMPGTTGLSGLAYLCGHYPALPVIMVSANDDPAVIRRAITDGAAGFISKSADTATIVEGISQVLDGETYAPIDLSAQSNEDTEEAQLARRVGELTPQQYKVLQMLTQGLLNKQIAYELNVTEATVKAHVTAIMRKLGVSNRTQAVTLYSQLAVARPEFRV